MVDAQLLAPCTATATRRSRLDPYAARFAAAGGPDTVRLAERPYLSMVELRVADDDPAVVGELSEALGQQLPQRIGDARWPGDGLGALWLGPGWWLVVGPPGSGAEAALAAAVAGRGSAVDVSAARTAVEITGPCAPDVLITGCRIDLHPRSFPVGACARTLVGRAPVILHHIAVPDDAPLGEGPAFRMLVGASFASYLADWLLDALTEHTG